MNIRHKMFSIFYVIKFTAKKLRVFLRCFSIVSWGRGGFTWGFFAVFFYCQLGQRRIIEGGDADKKFGHA